MITSHKSPPPLPLSMAATKDQRIRAGLIDHFIDSTLWFWLFILVGWSVFHLDSAVDARSFLLRLAINFSISMSVIALFLVVDSVLCIVLQQSIGQLVNGIYKENQKLTSQLRLFTIFKIWFHGLLSRCLGMPLLGLFFVIVFIVNPIITPIHLQDFSLIEPEGAYRLLVFLLKIIGDISLLFGLFLPFGLGFIRGQLPTWYDRLLGIQIKQKPHHRISNYFE